jgi:F-type H+-transporting ATPase subunit b
VTARFFLGPWIVAAAAWLAVGSPQSAADASGQPTNTAAAEAVAHQNAAGDDAAGEVDASSHDAAEADHAAHEHDPYDLSHGNAGPLMGNPIEWRYDLAVASFAVFVVLFSLLSRFAWGAIRDGLDRREQAVAGRLEAAQRSADEAAEQLRLYQEKLAAAGQEAQDLVTQTRRTAEAEAEAFRRETQTAMAREQERAIADIQAAKNAAIQQVAHHAADLAVLLAGRIIRRELDPQDHAAMIAEALEKFPSQN